MPLLLSLGRVSPGMPQEEWSSGEAGGYCGILTTAACAEPWLGFGLPIASNLSRAHLNEGRVRREPTRTIRVRDQIRVGTLETHFVAPDCPSISRLRKQVTGCRSKDLQDHTDGVYYEYIDLLETEITMITSTCL